MKRIYFLRHAKSSWEDFSLKDFDRPLNKRGLGDAVLMSTHMRDNLVRPDCVISSAAKRTNMTANIFLETLGLPISALLLQLDLYHADIYKYLEYIPALEEKIESVLFIGHNPTMTYLMNEVSDTYVDNVPTCGLMAISSDISKWSEFEIKDAKLDHYFYPKMFKN